MRRLLFAALLTLPSIAWADEPNPDLLTTKMFGCSVSGVCINFSVWSFPAIDNDGFPTFRSLAGVTSVQCPTVALCGTNGFRTIVYDQQGDRIMSYENGNVPRYFAEPPQPFFALVNFGWLPIDENNYAIEGFRATPVSIVVTTTPEPLSMALVGTGLVVLGAVRRRRQNTIPESA